MKKEHILNEIRRTADKETNQALGDIRLEKETGIKKSDWYGIYWTKRSDADRDAGCKPNKFNKEGFNKEWLIEQLIDFIKEIGRYPIDPELKMKKRTDKDFPGVGAFRKIISDYNTNRHKKWLNIVRKITSFQM